MGVNRGSTVSLPDTKADIADPGDMVQNRFRFQAAFAGYIALRLLDDTHEYDCIYCEQYEDILVKLKNGRFIGIQVKTRDKSCGPFKFSDDEIIQSIKRFIKHECEFPNRFSKYIITTNAGFSSAVTNNNLEKILVLVKKHKGSTTCLNEIDFSKNLEKLCNKSGCDKKVALLVLNKLSIIHWADLENYKTILARDIGIITNNKTQPWIILEAIAAELITLTSNAACQNTSLTEPNYYKLLRSPEETILNAILENKCVTSTMVNTCLDKHLNSTITLQSISPTPIPLVPKGTKIMEIKMTHSGISSENIDLMKDNNYSAQQLFIGWLYKLGKSDAERHADHISLLVRNECQEAKDIIENEFAKIESTIYGTEMLQNIRSRLRNNHMALVNDYKDLRYPHLLGIAGILTEECKLWWSKKFPIKLQDTGD